MILLKQKYEMKLLPVSGYCFLYSINKTIIDKALQSLHHCTIMKLIKLLCLLWSRGKPTKMNLGENKVDQKCNILQNNKNSWKAPQQ